jgi:hypothetical protein
MADRFKKERLFILRLLYPRKRTLPTGFYKSVSRLIHRPVPFRAPALPIPPAALHSCARSTGGECWGTRWGTLPTKIQRELFDQATSLADLAQTPSAKGQIARFLHNHRDDGARTTRTMPGRVVM